jgi:hypothetical protein
MNRSWNGSIWAGFVVVAAGLLSYIPVFAQYPATRDFPWVNLLMFAAGLVLLGVGLRRAYGRRERYHGRVFGPLLTLLSVAGICFFVWGIFIVARDLPASASAPHVGQKAPDFSLPDQDGKPVALADLLSGSNAALLIFYRGYW